MSARQDKKQYLKQSISLAGRYGYLFETQLRKTGSMTFETTLDDFDSAYPGSYEGRIRRVDVSVQGIVPPSGVSGTLSNNGISVFRLPFDLATPSAPSRVRIQIPETLVLSDYDPAQDGVRDSSTRNQTGIFEGAGVAGSWTLKPAPGRQRHQLRHAHRRRLDFPVRSPLRPAAGPAGAVRPGRPSRL